MLPVLVLSSPHRSLRNPLSRTWSRDKAPSALWSCVLDSVRKASLPVSATITSSTAADDIPLLPLKTIFAGLTAPCSGVQHLPHPFRDTLFFFFSLKKIYFLGNQPRRCLTAGRALIPWCLIDHTCSESACATKEVVFGET